MDDQPEGNARFSVQGPDVNGCVWISSTAIIGWQHNLGPADKAAEILSKWLASLVPVSTVQLTQDE
jgi:hypothetical protein